MYNGKEECLSISSWLCCIEINKPQQTQKAEFLRCIYLGSLSSLSSRWQPFLATASCVFLASRIKVRPFRSCLNAFCLPSSSWLSLTTSHCPQWTKSVTCPANSSPHSASEDQGDAFIHATLSKATHLRSNSLRILSISIIHGRAPAFLRLTPMKDKAGRALVVLRHECGVGKTLWAQRIISFWSAA